MREYSIWFPDWSKHRPDESQWPEIMRPNSVPWGLVTGADDYRIEVEQIEITISDDGRLGIHLIFHGSNVPKELAQQVVEEISCNIQRATGQKGMIAESHPH
jgi:hypothetical protein